MSDPEHIFETLSEPLRRGIEDLGWREPMPVQAKVIPLMRGDRDLIVQAQTGSGKTGAFGIPLVQIVDPDNNTTQALVMTPTRELASQVGSEITAISRHTGVRCLAIYGGVGYGPQLEGLQQGAHIVVGTPGRILDHLGSGRMNLDELQVLIMDEADEMLSLGFWPDMRAIYEYLPAKRRSHLFSATIPEKVRSLSRYFLEDPEFVTLSEGQLAPQQIEHFFYLVTAQQKESTLTRVLEFEDPESAIIFCNTKSDVRFLTSYLLKRGFDADQISGDLPQQARQAAMNKIKAGKLRFLVATDVAARGIDISELTHVISYATPESPDVYVHRTGRTGRAGRAGVAISLVSGLDIGNFRHLQHVNQITITERSIPSANDIVVRIRERLMVKVEQEMRLIPDSIVNFQVERLSRVVEELTTTDDGRRDLAAVCAAYLREHRPETTVTDPEKSHPVQSESAGPEKQRPAAGSRGRRRRGSSSRPREGGGGGGRRGR